MQIQDSLLIYINILLLVLAGMFKAVADTLIHHFDTSIFRKKDRKFWDPNISWKYAKYLPATKYKVDAWHLANSFQIICWCAVIANVAIADIGYHWLIVFFAAGIIFNLSFNLFYNKILR